MAKIKQKKPTESFVSKKQEVPNSFYFQKENYRLMLIGLICIVLGFLLMLGADANTVDGKYNPNIWNDGIFSVIRIRIAPLLVVVGFVLEVFAILKISKNSIN